VKKKLAGLWYNQRMTAETLRKNCVKEIEESGSKIGPHSLANFLAFRLKVIFNPDDPKNAQFVSAILKELGYSDIEALKTDVIALVNGLRKELGPDWQEYFGRWEKYFK